MTAAWTYGRSLYPELPGFDPYAEWSFGPGRPYAFAASGPPPWIPVLLRLEGVRPSEFADGGDFIDAANKPAWRMMVRIPELAMHRNEEGYCPALVKETFFKELQANPKARARVPSLQLSEPLPPDSLPPPPPSGP